MLETFVLVGLDWAKPMMNFSLHVTCSCIVHAYVPFHYLFWYFFVIGTLCLFLSLSPSLSNSLRMAPKRKSAPSRNPLHYEASFSDPTPLSIQFCDKKAR